jgi:hypothetical protein
MSNSPEDAAQARRMAMLFKLLGATITPTPDGGIDVQPPPPELEPVVAWLRDRPAIALQAQADVAATSETLRQQAEALRTVLHELTTGLTPEARGLAQVQAYFLAESAGWTVALALSALRTEAASTTTPSPVDLTGLHIGNYL